MNENIFVSGGDLVINYSLKIGGVIAPLGSVPFSLRYYNPNDESNYVEASFDGNTYKNITPEGDHYVIGIKDVNFEVGRMFCWERIQVPSSYFADGKRTDSSRYDVGEIVKETTNLDNVNTQVNFLQGVWFNFPNRYVDVLPAVGANGVFYFVPNGGNATNIYIYSDAEFHLVGSTSISLADFYTKAETQQIIDDLDTNLQGQINTHSSQIQDIVTAYIDNKGYFATLTSLQASHPTPEIGDTAYVADALSSTGYYIYNVVDGIWTSSIVEAPPVAVAIGDYALHGGSTKTLKEVTDELDLLEQEQIQGGVYDVSSHNNDAVFESLSALLSDANLSILIPTSVRHGGMNIRFIQGSVLNPNNKYVQYKLKSKTWDTNVGVWEIITTCLNNINYLPKPYVTPNKYSAFMTDIGDIVTGGVDNILGGRIEYVKWHFLANSFNGYTESNQPLPAGNYFFNCLIKSSVANTLNFIVFDSGSHYSRKDGIELEANKWTFISCPFTSDANSTYLNIRFDIISADCDFYYARPSVTDVETQLGQIKNLYLENNNNELLTIDKGLNLFKGCDTIGYYLDTAGSRNANEDYNISRPIKVKQGDKYTINHCHIVIGYDINNEPLWSFTDEATLFGETTFTIPYGINYIRTNVRVDFVDFTINHGTTATNNENYELDGGLLKPKSVHMEQLGNDVEIGVPDGTITQEKLANSLVQYLSNAANLSNETITQEKLSSSLIQWIQSQGGGSITNNADGISIIVNSLNQLSINWESAGIFFTKTGDDTQGIITKIGAYNGKATLILLNDLTVHNSYTTFPSNLYKVIGAGGKIIPYGERVSYVYLTFQNGCIFEGGYYQMFNKWIILSCSDGWLEGSALCDWWGCEKDGVTDCGIAMSAFMGSTFKEVRFTKGIYVAYPSNGISGRTIIFDEGSIIDGVFHIAYGDYVNKTYCYNTRVIGQCVSTLRIGGAYIDGLSMPDGIKILAPNAIYINQTIEGTSKGVHFNFSNRNMSFGDIIIEETNDNYSGGNLTASYALGIGGVVGHERPKNIHIKNLYCGENKTTAQQDILLLDVDNISFGSIYCVGGTTPQYIIVATNCTNLKIDYADITYNNPTGYGVYLNNGSNHTINTIKISSNISNSYFGIFMQDINSVFINRLITKNQIQGARLIRGNYISIIIHETQNDTTPIATSDSNYYVGKSFVII